MSMTETDEQLGSAEIENAVRPSPVPLRWWPAAAFLVAMLACRLLLKFVESPSFLLMMVAYMGPAFFGLLVLFWWCFASRATGKEKVIGLFSVVAIAAVAIGLIHYSMIGFGLAIMVFPTGIAAFTLGLILFSRSPGRRVPVALVLAALGFGVWDLLQSEGLTGDFKPQLLWRWQPTAEDTYLASLASRQLSDTDAQAALDPDATKIGLHNASWPSFRGSDRSGVVTGITLSEDWVKSPPNEIWRTRIGPGWSSFSVAADRLFTQEQRGEQEVVLCLNADDGKVVWEYAYPSRFYEAIGGPGPRATPTIADEGLYALGADGVLVCLDATRGTEIWRRDLKVDADRKPPIWGFSASPLVIDSMVIVHAGGPDDKGVLAYAADSGEIVWSVPSGDHSYSSPQLAEFDSVPGILMVSNDGVQFLNKSNGETIWNYDQPGDAFRVLQPLVLGSSVLMSTSSNQGTQKFTVSSAGDQAWNVSEDWTSMDMKSEFSDYVAYEDHLYGFDGSIFACIDLETGTRQWKRGRYGTGQLILLSDSGQLLIASEKGDLVLVNATPEKLNEVAKISVVDGKTWNHPVLVGDRLYMRNASEAVCYELPLSD
tara:strand:+ start:619107 stop:620900 length:1794 start_codon:yes stop_codon:yes gene_type:complete